MSVQPCDGAIAGIAADLLERLRRQEGDHEERRGDGEDEQEPQPAHEREAGRAEDDELGQVARGLACGLGADQREAREPEVEE